MIRATMAENCRDEAQIASSFNSLGQFGRPDEIAEANLWLCSDASSYVAGQALAVDAVYLTRAP